jgi:4'-phosphopantetheinyl transferase EntD
MLRGIIREDVAVYETAGFVPPPLFLFREEEESLGTCVEQRRHEFALGRACARAALTQLGYLRQPIRRGKTREPIWPPGIVGSITHCKGYCAAAVARAEECGTLGIDAELNERLPEGSLSLIANAEELTMLSHLRDSAICWDRLLFSAKESLYKAWYPIERVWLGFEDACIKFVPETREFTANVLSQPAPQLFPRIVTGRFALSDRHLVTALVLPPIGRHRSAAHWGADAKL